MNVFDVDGVLIRSNAVKADAYRLAALPWGPEVATAAVELQARLGSMSRRDKWARIFTDLIGATPDGPQFDTTVEHCTRLIAEAVARCPQVPGAREFVGRSAGAIVVSGVRQPELGRVLDAHGFGYLPAFGGTKADLLPELVADGMIDLPATYYGDTRDDWIAAVAAGLEFVLVTCDTAWSSWRSEYDGVHVANFVGLREAA